MKLFKHLKSDATSGFLVFLIALPLCLGIAKASGFPPIAGIYTAVVGGLIVTFLTNSQLTIKGPAAGLIVIAIGAVEELGAGNIVRGYQLTLAIIVVSGVIQVGLGLIKSGKLGDFFPASVIHGMLAAIGLIIMSKQIHVAMGVVPTSKSPFDLIVEIPHSLQNMNPEIALIGFVSLLILFLHPVIKLPAIKKIPAPLLVLMAAVPLSFYFDLSHEHDYDLGSLHFHIDPTQLLVALPDNFFSGLTFPDFSQITSAVSIKYIIMFALVGSIESLLSAKAIDSLDPEKRKSDMNLDLVAVGVGNTIAGFIGGLPMISEIVRSSSNINNGAKSKMSNFFHGLFLFLFALLAAPLIQKIPNAALAAMLVFTGFRLASPGEFKKTKRFGYDQLFLFITTLVVTIFTDLLLGVGVGIIAKIVLHTMQGARLKNLPKLKLKKEIDENAQVWTFHGPATFMNYLKFKAEIDKEVRTANITLDFTAAKLVDHTFMENLHQLQNEFLRAKGQLNLIGFEKYHFQSDHPLAARKSICNPENTVSKQLTGRDLKYKELATANGYDFTRKPSATLFKQLISPFSILTYYRYTERLIANYFTGGNINLADVVIHQIVDFSTERKVASVALITNLETQLPAFYLEDANTIHNLKTHYDFKEIRLNDHSFSKKFKLSGNNQAELAAFFTDTVCQFLVEQNKHKYTIVSKGNAVLIHKDYDKLNQKELTDLLVFAQNWLKLL